MKREEDIKLFQWLINQSSEMHCTLLAKISDKSTVLLVTKEIASVFYFYSFCFCIGSKFFKLFVLYVQDYPLCDASGAQAKLSVKTGSQCTLLPEP